MIKIITILAVALLLLSMVSLGIALLKPVQPEISSVQGRVIVNVIGPLAQAEPSIITGTGNVIVNVI
jgi:hypothetical protein